MTLTLRPSADGFAGIASGIDLSHPLDAGTIQAISDGIDRYAVLVFHGQSLDAEAQIRFGRYFGELEVSSKKYNKENKFRTNENFIIDVSNLDENNALRARDDRRRLESLANRLWHTDASFRAVPGALSMLYAVTVPPVKGETEFADLRAAYDALPDDEKEAIEDLMAEHVSWHSRSMLGFPSLTEAEVAALPPVPQRVVRRHPGSGRKTLYIGAHAAHIVGWPVPEGRVLLLDLLEHATRREFVYRHRWQAGDLVIWDNRCTLHRSRPFDTSYPRDLRRITTRDVASTLDQPR